MHLRHDIAEVPEREVYLVRRESGLTLGKDLENQAEEEQEGAVTKNEHDRAIMCLRNDIAEVPEKEVHR